MSSTNVWQIDRTQRVTCQGIYKMHDCKNIKTIIQLTFFFCRALKDQGYESDSTLVFRKNQSAQQKCHLSPVQQKQAYVNLQSGGEVPVHGFRKPAPEKPKG